MTGRGIGGHQSSAAKTEDWLTPPHILTALGPFDLDPCASLSRPWPTAQHHLTVEDDGLSHDWFGRVWLNPPYGKKTATWLDRLAAHGRGTALIFARTETDMFVRQVWHRATAVLFLYGRLHFHHAVSGERAPANSGGPSALIAYGDDDADRLLTSGLPGALCRDWKTVA